MQRDARWRSLECFCSWSASLAASCANIPRLALPLSLEERKEGSHDAPHRPLVDDGTLPSASDRHPSRLTCSLRLPAGTALLTRRGNRSVKPWQYLWREETMSRISKNILPPEGVGTYTGLAG
jgi:hypothetical protein